jgi:hypothetical protein
VPPATQLVTLLSLAMTGVVLGHVVRRARWMAEDYAGRISAVEKSGVGGQLQ